MPEFLNRISGQLTEMWSKFTTRQKIQIVATFAIVVIALVVLVVLLNKPNYVVLKDELEPIDINTITDKLTEDGITSSISDDGTTVLVEASRKQEAILSLAEVNIIASGDMTYQELFNNSIMTSDSEKAIKYQEFFQSELGRKIEKLNMIEEASVTLVVPETDRTIFDDVKESKGSIILTSSGELSSTAVESIAKFITNAVINLEVNNITIIDSNGRLLFDGSSNNNELNSINGSDYELQLESLVKNNVRSLLLSAGAYDNAMVAVDLAIDYDKLEKVSEIHTTPDGSTRGIIDSESTYEEESVNSQSGGTPGTDSNGPTDTLVEEGSDSTVTIVENNKDYVFNTDVITSIKAVGAIIYDESTVTVSLTKYKYYNEAILEKQENSPLTDLTWEEYKFNVIEQGRAKIDEIDEDIIQMVKNSSKIDKVVVLAYEEPQFIPKIVEPSPVSDYVLIGIIVIMILLLGYAVYKGTEPVEIKEIEPELSVEELLTTTKAMSDLDSIEFDGKSDARVQIEQFVEENPDAVALLLRNWLNEDWE